MDNSFLLLRSFSTVLEAEIVRGRLESEGIECQLRDEFTVATNWLYSNAVGGVKLCVLSSQFEEAVRILETAPDDEPIADAPEKVIPLWGVCPSCKSTETEYRSDGMWQGLSFLFFGLPLFRAKRLLHCRSCGLSSDFPEENS